MLKLILIKKVCSIVYHVLVHTSVVQVSSHKLSNQPSVIYIHIAIHYVQ